MLPGDPIHITLTGADVGDRVFLSWVWSNGIVGHAVVPRAPLDRSLDAFELALPFPRPLSSSLPQPAALERRDPSADEEPDGRFPILDAELRRHRDQPTEVAKILTVRGWADSALCSHEGERALSGDLARVLLPDELVAQLERHVDDLLPTPDGPSSVTLRILSPGSCARVPWELLVVPTDREPDRRLLDLVDVVMLAPIVRDKPASLAPRRPEHGELGPAIRIIDQEPRHVLSSEDRDRWAERENVDPEPITRRSLSSRLRTAPRPSRLLYVGHVSASGETAADASLHLGEAPREYGLAPLAASGCRPFSARDLLVGTSGYHRRFPDEAIRQRVFGAEGPVVPDAARVPEGGIRELAGRELWPMPPHVALIACQSGLDVRHHEPFGLVSACLELGAETVIATRWMLVAVRALRMLGASAALDTLAREIDELQGALSVTPNAFSVWQRHRLQRWRKTQSIGESPLLWAAVGLFQSAELPGKR